MLRFIRCALALSILSSCQASAPPPSTATRASGAQETKHWNWTVAAGDIAEVNVQLAPGGRMAAKYVAAGGAITWNVHSHDASGTAVYQKGEGLTGSLAYAAQVPGVYSCLWVNSGTAPTNLSVDLVIEGEGTIHSTHP